MTFLSAPAVLVYVGPAGDRNTLGARGAEVVGSALARRLGVEAQVVGTPVDVVDGGWAVQLEAALPALRELQESHDAVRTAGRTPVTALPRCAAALATLPALVAQHPDAVVVWMDAHGDLNTPVTTPTGYLGGIVISGALGWWESGLGAGVEPEAVVLVGARDLDVAEQDVVDSGTVRLAAGPDLLADLDRFVGDRPVYVHLDCDVLEPGTVPTEYAVPDGLTLDDLAAIAGRLAQNTVLGLEIAELQTTTTPGEAEAAVGRLLEALAPLLATAAPSTGATRAARA